MTLPAKSVSARLGKEPVPCPECRSTSRVGRGFCLVCLLYSGIGADADNSETLESVLAEIDGRLAAGQLSNFGRDRAWRDGGYLSRPAKAFAAYRRAKTDLIVSRRFAGNAGAFSPRSASRRESRSSKHSAHLRSGRERGRVSVLQHEVRLRWQLARRRTGFGQRTAPQRGANGKGGARRAVRAHSRGLAKWLDTVSDLTRSLTIFGTPGYIAPEQAKGSAPNLTPAADVYSLGAILFDLFTGRPPFLGEHALAVIQQAAEKPAPKLRSLAPKLDRDLETICAKCLEREPNARYRSAGDLAEDLERWLAGRHIIARPVSAPVLALRWSRRNPITAGLAALLLTVQ